jgi:septation ring formation regulator EzrA
MADKTTEKTSQSQQSIPQQAFDTWKKVVDDQVTRLGAAYEEMAKFEGRGLEQIRTVIDESARVLKEAVAYGAQYTSELRRVSLDAAKKTVEARTPEFEKTFSQLQKDVAARQQQAFDLWRQVVDEQLSRLGAVYSELGKIEGRGSDQLRTAVDEGSRFMKDTFAYASQYASEWQRLTFEATRRVAELMKPRA